MISKKVLAAVGCAVVVGIGALGAVLAFSGDNNNSSDGSSVADVLEPTAAPTEATLPQIENFSDEPVGLTGRAKMLLNENKDVVGYISISNTNVDYPVVQYQGEDPETNGNDYYLHRDLYGNYLESGTIFMDYRDVFGADESKQSENIVLYGHNMLTGTKFTDLHKYRKDYDFYDENHIIEFSSNYKDYEYVIFACLITSGSYGDSYYGEEFAYWDMQELDTQEAFDSYVETCMDRALFDTGVDVSYGDKLLTLSTCHLDEDNSRLLVVARRLRDNETVNNIDMVEGADKPEDDDDSQSDEEE